MLTRASRRPDEIVGRWRRPLRRVRRAAGARRSLAFIGTLVAAVLSLPALAVAAPAWLGPQHVATAGAAADDTRGFQLVVEADLFRRLREFTGRLELRRPFGLLVFQPFQAVQRAPHA